MSETTSFIFTDLTTVIITVFVGATVLALIYIANISNSSGEEKEVANKGNEVSRKKKPNESSGGVQKAGKKKHTEKWSQDSNKQNFSHSWLLTSLKGHSGRVLDMDFSSNGKFLATCAEDTTDDLDPGGGSEQCSGNSSGSEGNKENNPQVGANLRTGLTRRQRRNRVRRDDDSPTARSSASSGKPASKKTSKGKTRRNSNNANVADKCLSNMRHNFVSALRQYTRLNLRDSDLSVFLRHYVLSSDQLMGLGYPVESALYPGKAIIYKNPSGATYPGAHKQSNAEHHSLNSSSHFFDVNAREFVPMSKQVVESCFSYESIEVNNTMYISSLVQNGHPGMDYGDIGVQWNAEHREKPKFAEKINFTEASNSSSDQVSSEETSSSRSQDVSESSDYYEMGDRSVGNNKDYKSTFELHKSKVDVSCSAEERKWSSSDEKKCVRCRRGFFVTLDGEYLTQEKCKYHWGKLQKVIDSRTSLHTEYSCCNGSSTSQGCTTGKLHVWNGVGVGVNGPFEGYVRTQPCKSPPQDGNFGIYALDCEMCFTTLGLELTKVTVVGADGRLVYDCLVQPENYIIDYNTRFSGITARDLKNSGATKSLTDVQNDLLGFINADTILIGHGLENDLKALRIIHGTVIDTSVVFPHYYGLPYRRSLKSLVGCFLKRKIQQDSSGHDSFEDARACTELMLWRIRKDFHTIVN